MKTIIMDVTFKLLSEEELKSLSDKVDLITLDTFSYVKFKISSEIEDK